MAQQNESQKFGCKEEEEDGKRKRKGTRSSKRRQGKERAHLHFVRVALGQQPPKVDTLESESKANERRVEKCRPCTFGLLQSVDLFVRGTSRTSSKLF